MDKRRKEGRVEQFGEVCQEMVALFAKKNEDYGDAFADSGTIGVLVSINNKIRRLQNITKTGITLVEDEKIRDTVLDLANYSVMFLMLLDEKEEGEEDEYEEEIDLFLDEDDEEETFNESDSIIDELFDEEK